MASTPDTNNIGIEIQAAGENLNTWGDTKLNVAIKVLSDLSSKWNPLTINGDYTVSETNYVTTNDTEVATIKLVAGTVSANFAFTIPGRNKRTLYWNNTGYTATIKLAATTGFTLPTGCVALLGTDGTTDAYNLSPNHIGTARTPVNNGDVANVLFVTTAIANASIPASAGTLLVSAGDTTANYAFNKLIENSDSLLLVSKANAGANETLNWSSRRVQRRASFIGQV